MTPAGSDGSAALSGPYAGHEDCRLNEFVRWNRIVLEHERDHLSRAMLGKAFKPQDEVAAIMHELADLDWCLAQLPRRVRTEVPGEDPQAG